MANKKIQKKEPPRKGISRNKLVIIIAAIILTLDISFGISS